MRHRFLVPWVLAAVAFVATAAPAFAVAGAATTATKSARSADANDDRKISISGGVVVARGETITGPVVSIDGSVLVDGTVDDDLLVGNGDLRINGRVTGDVLVAHGDIRITGRVGGDVVAVSGRVTVDDGAHVGGDVVSRFAPRVAGGTVAGDVKRVNLENIFTGLIVAFLAFLWIAVTVSIAVLGLVFVLLFPRAAEMSAAAGKRVGASFGWGALVGVVGPFFAALVLVTVVGIPLGVGMVSALNVLAPLGYVTTALVIGRLWVKGRTPKRTVGAFFAGFGVLRLVALVPGVGFVVWLVACVYGLGALSIAAWHGGHATGPSAPGAGAPGAGAPGAGALGAAAPALVAPTTDSATTDTATTDTATTDTATTDTATTDAGTGAADRNDAAAPAPTTNWTDSPNG